VSTREGRRRGRSKARAKTAEGSRKTSLSCWTDAESKARRKEDGLMNARKMMRRKEDKVCLMEKSEDILITKYCTATTTPAGPISSLSSRTLTVCIRRRRQLYRYRDDVSCVTQQQDRPRIFPSRDSEHKYRAGGNMIAIEMTSRMSFGHELRAGGTSIAAQTPRLDSSLAISIKETGSVDARERSTGPTCILCSIRNRYLGN